MIALAIPRSELGSRAEARTKEIERALKMQAEYILMMDLDQTVPNASFYEFGLALNQMESGPFAPDIWIIDAPDKNGHAPSNVYHHPDGTLAYFTISCCLLNASIFKRLERPWFSSEWAYANERIERGKLVWDIQKKYSDDNRGEDVYFAHKVLDVGLEVRVIQNLTCSHFNLEAL